MPMHQKMITIGFAALFALVLAGCGSGSESPMTMEPTEPPLDEDELARLQEELEALRGGPPPEGRGRPVAGADRR